MHVWNNTAAFFSDCVVPLRPGIIFSVYSEYPTPREESHRHFWPNLREASYDTRPTVVHVYVEFRADAGTLSEIVNTFTESAERAGKFSDSSATTFGAVWQLDTNAPISIKAIALFFISFYLLYNAPNAKNYLQNPLRENNPQYNVSLHFFQSRINPSTSFLIIFRPFESYIFSK